LGLDKRFLLVFLGKEFCLFLFRAFAVLKKAVQSFRLRLHSGLRQSGGRFAAGLRRGAEAPLYLRSNGKGKGKNKDKIQGSLPCARPSVAPVEMTFGWGWV